MILYLTAVAIDNRRLPYCMFDLDKNENDG